MAKNFFPFVGAGIVWMYVMMGESEEEERESVVI